MKYYNVLLFIFFHINSLIGQAIITGSVKSEGKPIQSASILVHEVIDSDTLVTAFSTTNLQGNYSLQLSKIQTIYRVCASCMGFETKCIDTTITQNLTYNFSLKAKVFELSEVEVRGIVPIKVKKDTVVFKAEAFRDGTEKNIEDLLKKLPGIKVNEKGDISFKGRSIEKLMIEGEDFFSKGYKLITKNVNADIIDKIEAIDNFVENPLLKDIEKSDKVALNITIDTKKKHLRLFGNAETSLANTEQYRLKTNVFTFRKKLKIGLISTNNTLGENPIPDAEYYLGTSSENSSIEKNPFILNSFKETINGLDDKRYLQNKANLAALNINYSPSEKFKIKQILYLFGDNNTQTGQNFSSFTNSNTPFSIKEKQEILRSPLSAVGILSIDYKINANSLLQFTFQFNNRKLEANSNIGSLINNTTDSIINKGFENGKRMSFETNFTHKFNKTTAFLAKLNYSWNTQQENLTINSKRFGYFFGLDSSISWVQQTYNRQLHLIDFDTKIIGVTKGIYYQAGVTFQYQNSKDLSQILFSAMENGVYNSVKQKSNDNIFSLSQLTGNISLTKKINKFQFLLGGKGNYVQGYINRLSNKSNEESILYFNPNIGISFNFNDNNQIRLSYSNIRSLPPSQYLLTNGILTDYRSIEEGYSEINFRGQNNFFGIIFSNHDWYNQFSLVSQILYNTEENLLLRSVDLSYPLVIKYRKFVSDKTNDNFQFRIQADKFFSNLKINTKIEFNAHASTFYNASNEIILNRNKLLNYKYILTIGTSFKSIFNYSLDFSSQFTRVNPENSASTFENQYSKSSFLLLFNFSKYLSCKIMNEVNYWKGGRGSGNTYFLDVDIDYKIPNTKFLLKIEGRNLLNNSRIDIVSSNDFLFQQSTFRLLKPYLLTGVHFSF